MHQLYQILRDENNLWDAAQFCNENGYLLTEIEPDEEGRRFQIVEMPPISEAELRSVQIGELKDLLHKYKEDVEQVELFGMERADYTEKKLKCAELIREIRELERMV